MYHSTYWTLCLQPLLEKTFKHSTARRTRRHSRQSTLDKTRKVQAQLLMPIQGIVKNVSWEGENSAHTVSAPKCGQKFGHWGWRGPHCSSPQSVSLRNMGTLKRKFKQFRISSFQNAKFCACGVAPLILSPLSIETVTAMWNTVS